MRLVKREEFLQLPVGTVYAKGTPFAFGGLQFKHESLTDDWYCLDPVGIDAVDSGEMMDRLEEMLAKGVSHPMNGDTCRDGYFDHGEIFMIFEREDLEQLRSHIDSALIVAQAQMAR